MNKDKQYRFAGQVWNWNKRSHCWTRGDTPTYPIWNELQFQFFADAGLVEPAIEMPGGTFTAACDGLKKMVDDGTARMEEGSK